MYSSTTYPTLSLSTEQANFRALVGDIAWYGLAFAATSRFLSVYAIRLGATPFELGLLTGLPALVWLFSSMLSAWWSGRYTNIVRALRVPALAMRFMFLLPMFAPLFPAHLQVPWLIIGITITAFPQGMANVMFMDSFRKAMPNPDRMTALLARRALALNITLAAGALAYGLWLEAGPFPFNYMLMFALAFGAGYMSYRMCMKIKVPDEVRVPRAQRVKVRPLANRPFRHVVMVAFAIHLAFTFISAIIPMRLVNELHAGESYVAVFGMVEVGAAALISLVAARIAQRLGSERLIAVGMIGTAISTLIVALSSNLVLVLVGAGLSGAMWTLAASLGLFRFFSDHTPASEGSVEFATTYNQAIGVALFAGPMLGSALATSGFSLVGVLLIGAGLRFASSIVPEIPALVQRRARTTTQLKPGL